MNIGLGSVYSAQMAVIVYNSRVSPRPSESRNSPEVNPALVGSSGQLEHTADLRIIINKMLALSCSCLQLLGSVLRNVSSDDIL